MRPRTRTVVAVLAAAAAGVAAPSAPAADAAPGAEQRREAFLPALEHELREFDRALFGPSRLPPAGPIDASRTCDDLSREVTALVPHSRSSRPSFYDYPANAAIVAVGTVITPAFYMLAIPEYFRFRERSYIDDARARIVELRAAMADRLCYAR